MVKTYLNITRAKMRPMNLRQQITSIGIAFLAVLFISALCFNLHIFQINQEAYHRQNMQTRDDIHAVLASHIDDIATLLTIVANDTDAATLVSMNRASDKASLTPYIRSLVDRLALLASANNDVNAIDLILPGQDRVISDRGQYSLATFLDRNRSAQLSELVYSRERIPFSIVSGETAGSYSTLNPYFKVQIHLYSATKAAYAAVVVSQESINNKLARQFSNKQIGIYALTSSGALYCWYDPQSATLDSAGALSAYQGSETSLQRDGVRYDVLRSELSGLRLVMFFPRNEIENAYTQSWLLLLLAALAFVTVAAGLYFMMLRWFYRPMSNLLANFVPESDLPRGENEYARISHTMSSMRASLASLEERMRNEDKLAGAQTQDRLHTLLTDTDSGSTPQRFAIFSLVVEDENGVFMEDKCRALFLLLENEYGMRVIYDQFDVHAGMIAFPDENVPVDKLNRALEGLLATGEFARMGVSAAYEDRALIPVAYEESRDMLDSPGPGMARAYQPGTTREKKRFQVTLAQQTELASRLSVGSQSVQECLEQIYADNCAVGLFGQCRLSLYLLDLMMVLASSGNAAESLLIDLDARWIGSKNPTFLQAQVYAYYKRLSDTLKPDSLSDALRDYVELHLSDFNLTLNDIAEHVNRSYSYVSTCFSKSFGMPFSVYLQKRRVAAAMRLLAETDQSVQQVAACVGYEAVSSFIRVFKKEIGITPGQYRDTVRQGQGASPRCPEAQRLRS